MAAELPPLRRDEALSGGTVRLLDDNFRILPRGRYYRLISEWILIEESAQDG